MSENPIDSYLNTVERMEPNIHHVDVSGASASIAISLKRIADVLEWLKKMGEEENANNRK